MSENPPPGLDEIHGSLTAPLLPALEGSEVIGGQAAPRTSEGPLRPTNPTLPTLSWDSASATTSTTPAPAPPAEPVASPVGSPPAEPPPPVPPAQVAPGVVSDVGAPAPAPAVSSPTAPVPAPAAPAPAPAPVVPVPAPVVPVPAPPQPVGTAPAAPGVLADFAAPGVPGQLTPHRGRDAFGAVVRTIVVAALVAAAVFGGRAAWDWNEGRHDQPASEVFPAGEVSALPVQTITFVRDLDGSGQMSATVDLTTGDYLVDVGDTSVARRGQLFFERSIAETDWVPTTEQGLASRSVALTRAEHAFLVMITDALPVEAHPFVTIVNDESVALPGSVIPGPEAIDIDEIESGPQLDEITTSGNSDVILDDVINDIADPAFDGDAGSTPTGPQVLTRHLTITVDRAAFTAAQPRAAHQFGFAGTTPVDVDVWVDSSGVVRKMSAPAGVGRLGQYYQLIDATLDAPDIFDGADFAPTEALPEAEEVTE